MKTRSLFVVVFAFAFVLFGCDAADETQCEDCTWDEIPEHTHTHDDLEGVAPERHQVMDDSLTTSENLWSASKINSEITSAITGTSLDHDDLGNIPADQHRELDDSSTTTTNLWSAEKISTELSAKQATVIRTTDYIAGQVNMVGPATGSPFVFYLDPNVFTGDPEEIDVIANGFAGTSSSSYSDALALYVRKTMHVSGSIEVQVYVKGYDQVTWDMKYINIEITALYIK